jgi:biotin carboxyl carrier protein
MKTLRLEIDGRVVEGTVASAKGTLWVHVDGETYSIDRVRSGARKGKRGGGAGHPGEITAPMPGKIIKVTVASGETVGANQVLLIMEAMKMEYTLKAQAAGKVAEVCCVPGQQVALGQTLMKLDVT